MPTSHKPLRLWPGVAIVTLTYLTWLALPFIVPGSAVYSMIGGVVGGLLVFVWWLVFSRAPWLERIGAIVVMVAAVFVTSRFVHQSVSNGMMGAMLPMFSFPVLSLALVIAAVVGRGFSSGLRRATMAVCILIGCAAFTLIRTGGINGEAQSDLHWRWTPTPEERLLAQPSAPLPAPISDKRPDVPVTAAAAVETTAPTATPAVIMKPAPAVVAEHVDWPGFRGADRNSIVRGVHIDTDWAKSPPLAMWRHPIGPGWSSFAVAGDLFYTQEQRGDDEVVSAYSVKTGEPAWRHSDKARFWESNAGAGPRGTPTINNGRVYAFGATGILNALDARDGSLVWTRNVAADTSVAIPGWGFSSSPLIVGDEVIVAASGRLAAYDVSTGAPRWMGPAGGTSYSSPQLSTIDGVSQVLLLNRGGATSVTPSDGKVLWEHPWPESSGNIVQPNQISDGDILISGIDFSASGNGMRRVAITHGSQGWTTEERWTTKSLKPSFSDYVVHKGYAYGFDGSIMAAVDIKDGTRKWKGGRYGQGQVMLLPDQDLLLVLSEEGELALVSASPDQFTEIARVPAIEGKTWNHPVLVGNILLVRNGEEMAAFRLK